MYASPANGTGILRLKRHLLRRLSNVAWNSYYRFLRLWHGHSRPYIRNENYARNHFVTGQISASALKSSPGSSNCLRP